jgi:hypothetical protein
MKCISRYSTNAQRKIETLIVALALHLMLLMPLHGRIGDSPKACADRYGVAIEESPDGGYINFEKDGLRVACRFAKGTCSVIRYSLINTGIVITEELGKERSLSEEQNTRILNLNRGGSTWTQVTKDDYNEIYKTSDGKLHASVNSVAVTIESVAFQQAQLAKVDAAAVDKTLTSFESGTGDVQSPAIKNLPDVPEQSDPIEESTKKLEKTMKEWQENTELRNRANLEAMASIDLIAKRVQKRQEMSDMLIRYKDLESALSAAKSPDDLKALREKEAALTAEMNQALKEYEVMDAEFKKSKPTDDSPAGK